MEFYCQKFRAEGKVRDSETDEELPTLVVKPPAKKSQVGQRNSRKFWSEFIFTTYCFMNFKLLTDSAQASKASGMSSSWITILFFRTLLSRLRSACRSKIPHRRQPTARSTRCTRSRGSANNQRRLVAWCHFASYENNISCSVPMVDSFDHLL